MKKPKLVRVTTVPISLDKLLEGQLKYMSDFYDITAVSAAEEDYLVGVAQREGVKSHAIELTRAITPLADLKALWQMVKFLKKEKPQIVHTHTPKAGTVGMLAAKIAGVPIRLHTVAGLPLLETQGKKRALLNAVEKITYAAATQVLPNSFGLKQIILEQGFAKENKLSVIGKGSSNGIDTSWFDPLEYDEAFKAQFRATLGISAENFVFVFVGRIVKDKGITELIQAFVHLNTPNKKLLLVGDYEHDLDPLPENILSEITSHPDIIHAGWQSDIRPYLAISDVLTFPSYREGFPNVVLQAGAMGLPAIVSDINGCNEIISHEENGLIVAVKDENALANAMQTLLTDACLRQQMKEQARPRIVENYRREYIWEEIHQFYEKELSKLK